MVDTMGIPIENRCGNGIHECLYIIDLLLERDLHLFPVGDIHDYADNSHNGPVRSKKSGL